jgi:hypothetical protein
LGKLALVAYAPADGDAFSCQACRFCRLPLESGDAAQPQERAGDPPSIADLVAECQASLVQSPRFFVGSLPASQRAQRVQNLGH